MFLWRKTWEVVRPLLFRLPPEQAHKLALKALSLPYKVSLPDNEALHVSVLGMKFLNPLGCAAGMDKDGVVLNGLSSLGFGFIEVGSITPTSQAGNALPRVFRVEKEQALVNRLGFNSQGLEAVVPRLRAWQGRCPLWVNLGVNAVTVEKTEDYLVGYQAVIPYAQALVLNVSSPNTKGLRLYQGARKLSKLLQRISRMREKLGFEQVPLVLKISPDWELGDLDEMIKVVLSFNIEGMIVSNSTMQRPKGVGEDLEGGLSGRPLFELSTMILREVKARVEDRLILIGCGGVFSAQDAFEKILSGAHLVQLYTALVYQGPRVVEKIIRGLGDIALSEGLSSLTQAVGRKV